MNIPKLLKYSFELLLDMEYYFPFRDILKEIHQINSGHPKYSHEYSFFILNISLVILVHEYSFFILNIST